MNILKVLKQRRQRNEYILSGGEVPSGHASVVALGSKFEYRNRGGREVVTSRGPLLAPLLVGIEGKSRSEGEVRVKYIQETKEDTLTTRHRYVKLW